ncbi:hypothetical protein Tco_1114159 [Tanacetum coccineum]|uniref:Uncharacterized protein n=1 Tax=Tanacetum coccineum TaxID=301880 RepID=A0ABQ5IU99_9ASTR
MGSSNYILPSLSTTEEKVPKKKNDASEDCKSLAISGENISQEGSQFEFFEKGVSTTANTQVSPASTPINTASTQMKEAPTNTALMTFSYSEGDFHPQDLDLAYLAKRSSNCLSLKAYEPKSSKSV